MTVLQQGGRLGVKWARQEQWSGTGGERRTSSWEAALLFSSRENCPSSITVLVRRSLDTAREKIISSTVSLPSSRITFTGLSTKTDITQYFIAPVKNYTWTYTSCYRCEVQFSILIGRLSIRIFHKTTTVALGTVQGRVIQYVIRRFYGNGSSTGVARTLV